MSRSRSNRIPIGRLSIALALLSSGCALFVSHYDATAYQYLTTLKAYHVKFLDDYTSGSTKMWDEASVKTVCDTGELRFREASEYALGKRDESRVRAIGFLHNIFASDCRLSLNTKKLFGNEFVTNEKSEAAKNYDWAIAGELDRVGAPAK